MFKKSKALMICFSMLVFLCLPFETNASGTSENHEFYVNYTEPSTDGLNGYINVMYQGGGGYRLYTYFWNIQYRGDSDYMENNGGTMLVAVHSDKLYFTFDNASTTVAVVTLACYDEQDNLHIIKSSEWASGGPHEIAVEDYSSTPIVGYSYSGNTSINPYSTLKDVPIPAVYWNNSVDAYWLDEKLNEILTKLGYIDYNTSNILAHLKNIYNENVSTNQKLENLKQLSSQIKAEQEESNTWLEKIFNWLKDSPEQEKQEAQTQGGNSVAEGTNAIENKGQGFSDSMDGLINSMSYNGTECSWTFPTVKLPAIAGVMEERVLIQNQDIDFGFWINSIPSNIMLLIRSVLTMALIVYCFKELYDTISYVLTLRGSNNE